jgi:hypothetical protein
MCPFKLANRAPAKKEKKTETEAEIKSTFLSKAIPDLQVALSL